MNQPLYHSVAQSLAEDIRAGRYRPNSKVPSIRECSSKKNVSISTVTKAYALLEDQGFIRSRPQSGYFVRHCLEASAPPVSKGEKPKPVTKLDLISQLLHRGADSELINLGSAIPDFEFLPIATLQKHTHKVTRYQRDDVFSFQLPPGREGLRQVLSQRVMDANIRCHADDILISTGVTESINHCLRACTNPGDIIAIESPCYYGFLQIASTLNLKVVEIPTDPNDGISHAALKLAIQQWPIKAILLSTRFSNPTGALIPKEKQKKLYELVQAHQIPIIEDDVYGELGYSGATQGVIKQFDREGLIMYCSSFSKTLSPGLRLGWCLPGKYYERVRQLQIASTWCVPNLTQLSVESYLSQGHYDRHLRKFRAAIEANTYKAANAIRARLRDSVTMSSPSGSFLLWLGLNRHVDINALHNAAYACGVNLAPGSLFSNTTHFERCLRINCALPWQQKLQPGINRLLDCIEQASRS